MSKQFQRRELHITEYFCASTIFWNPFFYSQISNSHKLALFCLFYREGNWGAGNADFCHCYYTAKQWSHGISIHFYQWINSHSLVKQTGKVIYNYYKFNITIRKYFLNKIVNKNNNHLEINISKLFHPFNWNSDCKWHFELDNFLVQ